eukprot:sb/3477424/
MSKLVTFSGITPPRGSPLPRINLVRHRLMMELRGRVNLDVRHSTVLEGPGFAITPNMVWMDWLVGVLGVPGVLYGRRSDHFPKMRFKRLDLRFLEIQDLPLVNTLISP